ncbi:hypothetical protein EGW08_009347 [Elysia chlorotica]|uniref:Uncharacterized protein n=1 Tax=Elysia chlorotica TaxID=188477 RepID=A0A3S1BG48_ELYCH|nr:hypothetical protein EGW08_009347 [Elysia chlorotica]
MTTNNPRQVMKPPRPLPGDLQTLPTLPWMFQWPMSAHERLILTNHTIYQQYPSSPCPATSHPYKDSWQFRDHSADDRVHPCHVDLRGGPKNVYNVAEKLPSQEPPQCDTRVSSNQPCCQESHVEPRNWFRQ